MIRWNHNFVLRYLIALRMCLLSMHVACKWRRFIFVISWHDETLFFWLRVNLLCTKLVITGCGWIIVYVPTYTGGIIRQRSIKIWCVRAELILQHSYVLMIYCKVNVFPKAPPPLTMINGWYFIHHHEASIKWDSTLFKVKRTITSTYNKFSGNGLYLHEAF